MKKETGETKICKHCKTEIPAGAKICPNCRKKQGGKLKWIIIAVVVIGIIGAAIGGGNDSSSNPNNSKTSDAKKEQKQEEQIEYTACNVNDMMTALDENAIGASDTYKDKYLEVTGVLGNIDSNGKYIDLMPSDDEFAISGVQCYIKNDEQKNAVANMKKGDTVTVRGKCTDVGEVLGYSLNIDSIN